MFGVRPAPNAEREETALSITTYDLTDLPELTDEPKTIGKCVYEDCDRQLVPQAIWDKATPAARKTWMKAGYYKLESHKACRLHSARITTAEHNEARRLEADRNSRYIAGKYRGLVRQGFRDPIGEIAFQLDITVEYIQRLLRRAGQPYERRDERILRRMAVIEEVEFFRSLGRGIHEICTKLDMTREQLAENMRHWRAQGYHQMDLDWLDTHDIMVYRNGYTAA
jgi:hypothetical protein